MGGSAAVLLVLGLGITGSISAEDPGELPRLIAASLAYAPALWVFVGSAAALFGVAPRFVGAAWGVLGALAFVGLMGPLLRLPDWVFDHSPLEHVPRMPVHSSRPPSSHSAGGIVQTHEREPRRMLAGGSGVDGVAVIGAGSSGLAVLRALRGHGVAVRCFERGSQAGGLWRYQNDNGLSSAYASLRTNVSRPRMEYPSFPMPAVYGDFPHHSDMAAYLEAYGESFGHRRFIRFRSTVERLEPVPDGTWRVLLDDGSVHRFRAAVVATGLHWCPKRPEHPGRFFGAVSHSHDYRVPEPFAGSRVLVVGGGQSAAEIAVEVSRVAARTYLSVRRGVHVIPRSIGGRPYDASDISPINRLPWRLLNVLYGRDVAREVGPIPAGWPTPPGRVLEGVPTISTDLLPAIRRRDVLVKRAVERLAGDRVRFVDGTEEPFDRIIYATGYRISLPFECPSLVAPRGREFPLYRRIVPLGLGGLLFAGFVDAPGGLLPVVEDQAEWIAALLTGHLRIPPTKQMRRAIDRAERRTRERFPEERPHSVRCDPHAYRRLLRSDLRRARRRAPRREGPTLFDDLVRTLEPLRKRLP